MNPVLKYRGGKSSEISRFEQYIPNKFNVYLEPFLGGGAVFFHLEPKKAILNDINKRLMTFYSQLRDNYPLLREQLDQLQDEYERNQEEYSAKKAKNPTDRIHNKNEDLYYCMREKFNYPDGSFLDGVMYFFINKTAYSGMIRYNNKGEYNVPFGRYKNFNTKLVTNQHCELLQNAALYNQDYLGIFNMASKNDFMFLDPPYDCVFKDYGNIDDANGFGEEQHIRLASDFRDLTCKALMIIGKTPLTLKLYKPYIIDEYFKSYSVNIKNRFNYDKMHLVIANF